MNRILLKCAMVMVISVACSLLITGVMMSANDMHDPRGYVIATVCPLVISPAISFLVFRQSEKLRQTLATLNTVMLELEITNAKLFEKSSRDSMTGLLNREAFFNHMEDMRVRQRGSLLIIDADHFKKINDMHGHYNGDGALMAIAQRIDDSIGPDDSLGRIGGEEFAVYLATDDEAQVKSIAETIRLEVNNIEYRTPENELIPLSVSIGGVVGVSSRTIADYFQIADRRLYEAKRSGRNCVCIQSKMQHAA
ncbi:GGDEF domain-containing protein [Phyllobacterium lublinensis]|jgi:diguanylate cyclase (GGDEF)-like protein|uniref:GGDEF domain-containing protein n=1 Tax=Phyllobacterium lublinensis TaxID=2875708 RepID=UPI001CCF5B54|nr:GGDEF domain-containing protein [Phyllobacterium sp. 2063]MBZ9656625.1 GGDEF domain-containing protein [Phyllobacterium sp. 2063]